MFVLCINNIKALLLFHNDAHNHTSLLCGCAVHGVQCTAHLHNRLVCCHDIDHVMNDEDIES
jgi:hypothetical protein